MQNDRATSILAVVRIVAVLGMAFAIASGIFMLLGGWILPGLAALAAFLPFFGVMRFMEKRALKG
jgi:predicted membrane metal-binding protein